MIGNNTVYFEKAAHADLEFIINLIANDAKDQHYHGIYCINAHLMHFKKGLSEVIQVGSMQRGGNNGVEKIESSLHIIKLGSGERIGFTLLSEKQAGSILTEIELYMLSIAPDHRYKGCGRLVIERILEDFPSGMRFFARCYPASTPMYNLLGNIGFEQIRVTPSGTRELSYLKA